MCEKNIFLLFNHENLKNVDGAEQEEKEDDDFKLNCKKRFTITNGSQITEVLMFFGWQNVL